MEIDINQELVRALHEREDFPHERTTIQWHTLNLEIAVLIAATVINSTRDEALKAAVAVTRRTTDDETSEKIKENFVELEKQYKKSLWRHVSDEKE